jgi:hypothetical protein
MKLFCFVTRHSSRAGGGERARGASVLQIAPNHKGRRGQQLLLQRWVWFYCCTRLCTGKLCAWVQGRFDLGAKSAKRNGKYTGREK